MFDTVKVVVAVILPPASMNPCAPVKSFNADTQQLDVTLEDIIKINAELQPKAMMQLRGYILLVENALKASFDWKKRLNLQKGINKEGSKVIYFNQAFHGRTGYTMTLTNTSDPRKTMYYPKFDWFKVDNPYLSFPITDTILKQSQIREQKVIERISNIITIFLDRNI